MPEKRPLLLTMLGCFFVFVGGIVSFVVFIQIIESVARFGAQSIGIESVDGFVGFFVFAVLPLLIYSTGIGLLMMRVWARKAIMYIFPAIIIIFLVTKSNFLIWTLIIGATLYYFNLPEIKSRFRE